MKQINIFISYEPSGLCSSNGTQVDIYHYHAYIPDHETNGRFEFSDWGIDCNDAADKVRRDHTKLCRRIYDALKDGIAKGELPGRTPEDLARYDTSDAVYVYFLEADYDYVNDTVHLQRKKIVYPRKYTAADKRRFLVEVYRFPEEV